MNITLDRQSIASALADVPLPLDVHCFTSVASTNVFVKRAIDEGVPEGYAAVALEQRAGYGRQGRSWVSPFGGLYVSLLLRPTVAPDQLPSIGPALSFAVCQALAGLAACPDEVRIKWPNDVVCPDGKLCGMSCEYVQGAFCIGIGVNVFRPAVIPQVGGKNRPAYLADRWDTASLASLDGVPLHPETVVRAGALQDDQLRALERVLCAVLVGVSQVYGQWQQHGFVSLQPDYLSHAALIGESVTAVTIDGVVRASGTVTGVDAYGQLLLRDNHGLLVPVNSGEIHLQ